MTTDYQVDVAGRLPESARSWFLDLGVTSFERSATTSTLIVRDQAALVGVLNRIHGLGIVILGVTRSSPVDAPVRER
jgi:hypothetical protein